MGKAIICLLWMVLILGCINDQPHGKISIDPIENLDEPIIIIDDGSYEPIDEHPDKTPISTTSTLSSQIGDPLKTTTTVQIRFQTFQPTGEELCSKDGKPIIRMYSKNLCEHCKWSGPIYDELVKGYIEQDKIVAYHWEFGTGDDLLTDSAESEIPVLEQDIFFDNNKFRTVPFFDFGCIYKRVGNGYYVRQDTELERQEMQDVIEYLIILASQSNP